MNNNHYTIVKNGLYTLKTKNETITGQSYLDCLEQLIKKPIPIKYAKFTLKQKFDWIEQQQKGQL